MPTLDTLLLKELEDLSQKDLLWKPRTLQGPSDAHAIVEGKKALVFCSNNYLGLSNHPALKEAATRAVQTHGAGSGSVRAIAGTMDLHLELEKTIAHFKHSEDAVYFQTGFAANQGTIPTLLAEGDLVISDELNHGSIIDGVRLTKAERAIYKHADMDDLARVLEEASKKSAYKKIWIITDGVFSMDGDIAPLDRIQKLAQAFGAYVYVDDAHGDGVLGSHGRGIVSHYGLEGKIEVEMGTFSKAFGCVGGSIAGSSALAKYAKNKARSYLLSGSAPPATAAACMAALQLLDKDDTLVKKLWENTNYFREKMKKLGFDTGNSQSPIIPVMCGESALAKKLSDELWLENVYALPIVFPMVARDKARIRCMINASHSRDDLDVAAGAFEKAGKKIGLLK
jgi:glycine C-acetyltransferase